MIEPICKPMMVTTGTSVFLSAWRKCTEAFRHAGRGREADEIRTHHFEHFGAHQPRDQVSWKSPSVIAGMTSAASPDFVRKPVRQKPISTRFAATIGWQHLQPHGEDVDEQDADQEGRQRDADERQGRTAATGRPLAGCRSERRAECRSRSQTARRRRRVRRSLETAPRRAS